MKWISFFLAAGILIQAGCMRPGREKLVVPEWPLLNDAKCLALAPWYVPRNTVAAWWGYQCEHASFFHRTTRYPSGRKPSAGEKVAFGVVVMPVGAVLTVPMSAIGGGVVPLAGHVTELFTLPFGRPLTFYRLDGSGFESTTHVPVVKTQPASGDESTKAQ